MYETPPPTQGLAALLTPQPARGLRSHAHASTRAEHLHLLLEMTKLAYADRDRWIADPAHARVPVEALLDKGYAASGGAAFDPGKAQDHRVGRRSTATPPASWWPTGAATS